MQRGRCSLQKGLSALNGGQVGAEGTGFAREACVSFEGGREGGLQAGGAPLHGGLLGRSQTGQTMGGVECWRERGVGESQERPQPPLIAQVCRLRPHSDADA